MERKPFEYLTLGELVTLLANYPPDTPIYVATATGSTKRAVMSVHEKNGSIILACAPPNSAQWASTADWNKSDSALAHELGISRQAINNMRQRAFGAPTRKRRRRRKDNVV